MRWILFFLLLCLTLAGHPVQAELDKEARAQAAVALARGGDHQTGLEAIRALISEFPDEPGLKYDEIAITFWTGDFERVLSLARSLSREQTPAYVASAVARSARNLKHFGLAITWYRAGLARAPARRDLQLGLAMSLADAGRHREARDTLTDMPAAETDVRLASAYLHRMDRAFVQAVAEYDRILAEDPHDREALRGKVEALRGLLLPDRALAVARDNPGLLSDAEVQRLEADALALKLRSAMWSPEKRYPFPNLHESLQEIDSRLAAVDPESRIGRQLRFDRIVALNAMNRWPEAVDEYEALQAERTPLPAYVLHTVGQAMLNLRRPENAEIILRQALEQTPADAEIRITLFYALIDQERFSEAITLIDELVASIDPVLRATPDSPGQPNPVHINVRIVAAMARAYADQLDQAAAMLESVLVDAPGNRQALTGLGHIYRWRGWPEKAEAIYRQVLSNRPTADLDAGLGLAHARLAQQDYEAVRQAMRRFSPPYLTYMSFDDIHLAWSQHFRSQILFDVRYGKSTGETFGSRQYDASFWWFSYPWRLNYRAYVRTQDSWAEFVEGNHARRRLAGGVEYRRSRLQLAAELSGDRFDMDDPGARIAADYRLSDRWLVGAEADFSSYATPLRADRADIQSDRYRLRARYRHSEWWRLSGEVAFQPFEDGNDVSSASVDGSYRLINGYTYKLDLYGGTSVLTSTLDAPVYFSPKSVYAVHAGVRNTWRQFRRYQQTLIHRLSADAGVYEQQGFGSDPTWTLDYELEWHLSAQVSLRGGLTLNRRVYDGGREDAWFVRFGLEGRL